MNTIPSLASFFRGATYEVPVRTQERSEPSPPPEPRPEVGLRWGNPSDFDWDAKRRGGRLIQQFTVEREDEEKVQEFSRVMKMRPSLSYQNDKYVRSQTDPETKYIKLRRMKRIAFRYNEALSEAPWGTHYTRTTIFDLKFELHPPPDKEGD